MTRRTPLPGRALLVIVTLVAVPLVAVPGWAQTNGPDLMVTDLEDVQRWGTVGGITGYSISATVCNNGDQVVNWLSTSPEHPLVGSQLYRLEDGRLEQIGMSWLYHSFCALSGGDCGACQATGCESLGIACSDTNGVAIIGSQSNLGPRSDVNGATGEFSYPFPTIGQTGNAIFKRLQVANDDLDPALHPNAQYFAEMLYISPDEPAFGTQFNNLAYRPVDVGPFVNGGFELQLTAGSTSAPALEAWQEADPGVAITSVTVPSDGRFVLGSRVTDLGGGDFRYEYALLNQNSDRSACSFSVPIGNGVTVSNIGFHDVDYHSGDPYDGTDWSFDLSGGALTWSTTPFDQDPDANALRWSTLYNFRFEADVAPEGSIATLGLFKPGTPDQVTVEALTPPAPVITDPTFVRGDADGSGAFSGLVDGFYLLNFQFAGGASPPCLEAADADGDDSVSGLVDALYMFNFQFTGGPPMPPPGTSCGEDDNYLLGCDVISCVP